MSGIRRHAVIGFFLSFCLRLSLHAAYLSMTESHPGLWVTGSAWPVVRTVLVLNIYNFLLSNKCQPLSLPVADMTARNFTLR